MQWAYCVVRHTFVSLEQNLSPVSLFRRCGTLVVPLGFDRVAESQGCIRAAYVFVHVYRQYLALIFLRRNVISHSFAFQWSLAVRRWRIVFTAEQIHRVIRLRFDRLKVAPKSDFWSLAVISVSLLAD